MTRDGSSVSTPSRVKIRQIVEWNHRALVGVESATGRFLWEFPFVYWLESLGYDVTYISNNDTHRDPLGLRRAAGFLSVGHDEYWTMKICRVMSSSSSATIVGLI